MAALSTATSVEGEGGFQKRNSDFDTNGQKLTPVKRTGKVLNATIVGGVKKDSLDPCNQYLRLVRDGEVGEIVELLKKLNEQGTVTQLAPVIKYKRFFEVCARCKPVPLKEAFAFAALCGLRDKRLYTQLVALCRDAGRIEEAFKLPAMMKAAGLKADTILYTSMVTACAGRGDSSGAFEAYAAMRAAGVAPNARTLAALAHACAREMRSLRKTSACDTTMQRRLKYLGDRAAGSLETMLELDLRPDVVMFNTMLDVCRQEGDLQKAVSTWEEMKRSGLEPTAQSFGTIMSACGDVGEHQLGLRYYQEFKTRGDVAGTKELYTCAMHMCASEGDLEDALRTFRDMREAGVEPDALAYAVLMDVAARGGRVESAFALLAEMQEEGVAPTAQVYGTLVAVCARSGLPERAWEIYERMAQRGVAPNEEVFNALIDAFGKAVQIPRAVGVLEEMRRSKVQPTQVTYGTIIHAASQAGDTELALQMFTQARRDGLVPSEALCDMVLLAILRKIRAGRLLPGTTAWIPKAVMVYRDCIVAGVRPRPKTLNKVLACLRRTKYSEEHHTPGAAYGSLPMARPPFGVARFGGYGAGAPASASGPWGGLGAAAPAHLRQRIQETADVATRDHEGLGLYESPAVTLYEEAQRLGTVPLFQLHKGGRVDLQDHSRDAACVAVLALLKHLRARNEAWTEGMNQIPRVYLQVKTLEVEPDDDEGFSYERELDFGRMAQGGRPEGYPRGGPSRAQGEVFNGQMASRSGIAVAKMLRLLKIEFTGTPVRGELCIPGKVLTRWFTRTGNGWEVGYETPGASLGGPEQWAQLGVDTKSFAPAPMKTPTYTTPSKPASVPSESSTIPPVPSSRVAGSVESPRPLRDPPTNSGGYVTYRFD